MRLKFIYLIIILNLFACNSLNIKSNTLFHQIGGMNTIQSLSTKLVIRLKSDAKIGFLFENTNEQDFQQLLVSQICKETGGECKYEGLDMQDAHSGMNINSREFDIFVQIFIRTMKDVGIDFRHQNKLLNIFAPMRVDILNN